MASKDNQEKKRGKEMADWSSDEEYEKSRGSAGDWQSDEWNEGSSLAGEASVMSEGTEEEQPEEEEERVQRNRKPKNQRSKKLANLNLDDVGTEDDGESRPPEDITERTEGKYSKTNASDISDMSDIEDQIAEAQHKFMDDKQSLTGVMGLVDEVTMKGEKLTRKASETSLVVERDSFKKGILSNDQLSLFDDDEISFRSYTDRTNVEEDHIPQRDLGKITSGRIEYMSYGEREEIVPKPLRLGHIEYMDENKSDDDSGSLISEQADSSVSRSIKEAIKDTKEDEKSEGSENFNETEAEDLLPEGESHLLDKPSLKSTNSSETFISRISNQLEDKSEHENCEKEEEENQDVLCEQDEIQEQFFESTELKEFQEPECSKFGEKHLCCFINLGGGGDDGRENELVNRLRKLKDDISNMRKELSLARQECKKESEEVAKLIEAAAARNRAAEQSEITLPASSSNMLLTYPPNYTVEEVMPTTLLTQTTILPGRTQVAIPTSLLEDRLRATRQNASSTYRNSLNELERMVEKEMASIKDSMIRLEPLNKIAAEWDAVLPVRDPKRTTYKSDYRLEMVTSEMRLKPPDVKTTAIQEIK